MTPGAPAPSWAGSSLRGGYTTGTCATAAAVAAARLLCGDEILESVHLELPDGTAATLPVESVGLDGEGAGAVVIKDAGDDPDVTHGARIEVHLAFAAEGDIRFRAGIGVGMVTRPGLALSVGEPAINPVPRKQIAEALRAITDRPLTVTVSVPTGEKLAAQTFNPRLGIEGGISIIGTSGRVRPFSHEAVQATIRSHLDVVLAGKPETLVLVPGHIGRRAALAMGIDEAQIVDVSNAWGCALDHLRSAGRQAGIIADPDNPAVCRRGLPTLFQLVVIGHPGKLAKLIDGHWDTHSHRSPPALPIVRRFAADLGIPPVDDANTVQGFFDACGPQPELVAALEHAIAEAIRACLPVPVDVHLIDLQGEAL